MGRGSLLVHITTPWNAPETTFEIRIGSGEKGISEFGANLAFVQ